MPLIYGSKTNSSLYDGDLIIQGDATYICRLKPGYDRTPGALPVEQQPIWQIECITTELDTDANTRITRMYPKGDDGYKFIAANYQEYTYEYRH